jgi:hypothetical protein
MTKETLAKILGGATVAATLFGANVALAQQYDRGTAGSSGVGTIVPSETRPTTDGATDPNGVSAGASATGGTTATPGVPNTGSTGDSTSGTDTSATPGVPNTGAGDATDTALALVASALVAAAAGAYLARQRVALR